MNREDVLQLLRTRYTTKHYDASRPVSDEDLAVLLEALRLSPTSVNGQYTKFFVAKTPEARARLMPAVMDFNQERVKNASHLIVFAVPKIPTEEHLRAVLEQETADGRFPADMPEGQYDVVVANILSNPLKLLAPALLGRVKKGGALVLSGVLARQAEEVIEVYRQTDPAVKLSVWKEEDGWVCIAGRRE